MAKSTLHIQRITIALGLVVLLLAGVRSPTAVASVCNSGGHYIVKWGDTLAVIAHRFGSTYSTLSEANGIRNPNRIFAGQSISIPGGGNCGLSTVETGAHIVERGETLWRIASIYGSSVHALVQMNGLRNPGMIYVGQHISIPVRLDKGHDPFFDALQLSTINPEQGRTLSLSMPLGTITKVSGTFGTSDILFFREGKNLFGLVGVDAFTSPGVYQLALHASDATGESHHYSRQMRLRDGGYKYEDIVLSSSVASLLSDPTVTLNERKLLENAVAPVNSVRYWRGVFQRASVGSITSDFGTRRSYNDGGYNSYHGGVDFSAHSGTEIRAPAAGIVVLAQRLHVRGNTTIIDHGLSVYSVLLHQDEIYVSAGDAVLAGQHIGKIGATGLVTGPHLHWEMYVGGVKVDPLQWTDAVLP